MQLFLPCKQQADATRILGREFNILLFLPCKQQADATYDTYKYISEWLFLPCKQQADATVFVNGKITCSCFYLANSRQMQQLEKPNKSIEVVFTLQTAGRCNCSKQNMLRN